MSRPPSDILDLSHTETVKYEQLSFLLLTKNSNCIVGNDFFQVKYNCKRLFEKLCADNILSSKQAGALGLEPVLDTGEKSFLLAREAG